MKRRSWLIMMPAVLAMPVLVGPVHVHASGSAPTAYVINDSSNNVTPIDLATHVVGTPIPVGASPQVSAMTPDGRKLFVPNFSDNDVSVIDTATNTVIATIAVGAAPDGMAITPNGAKAYEPNFADSTVSVIDTATDTVSATVVLPGGSDPQGIGITPDGTEVYVLNVSGTISVLSTATDTVVATIAMAAGSALSDVAFTPDGRTAYVADQIHNDVVPVDVATKTVGVPIATGLAPTQVAITPDGTAAYVTNATSNTVSVINTAANTVTTVASASFNTPFGVAITPDGTTAYVINSGNNTVSLIDTAGNTVSGAAISTGGTFSVDVTITPDQAPVARLSVTAAAAGQATTFNASASTVEFGSIASYVWEFGDGGSATTSSPITTHVYGAAGTYPASVTERSSAGTSTAEVFTGKTASRTGGASAVASQNVVVAGVPVPATGTGPYRETAPPLPGALLILLGGALLRRTRISRPGRLG
jgi:YVTN family beta-propeller protein